MKKNIVTKKLVHEKNCVKKSELTQETVRRLEGVQGSVGDLTPMPEPFGSGRRGSGAGGGGGW